MRALTALALTLVALGAAACGGDDETADTVPAVPELTVPGGETPTLDDLPASTTGTDTAPEAAGGGGAGQAPAGGGAGQEGQSGGGAGQEGQSGGQAAPEDNPENDTPPPPGSPAEKFEQFCEENPTAC